MGCWLKDDTCTRPLEKEWSLDLVVTKANCPMDSLIINGNHESEPVDQADSMTSALHSKGCGVTEVIRQGSQHSFTYWPSVEPQIVAFVAAR